MTQAEFQLNSVRDAEVFGERFGELLFPGAVVALVGPMGAGKTTLIRSISKGLGADVRGVSSPTFALVHEYAGRMPVYHFDTYRLADEQAFANLGAAEYFDGDGVCLIEWADRVVSLLPAERIQLSIEIVGEEVRRVALRPFGRHYEAIVEQIKRQTN